MKKIRFFNKYRFILTMILVSCSLLMSTCQDYDASPYEPIPEGKGSVTLIVGGGDARTISPDPVKVTIVAYTIKFFATGTSTVLETFDRTPTTLPNPFYLEPKTYDIQVTAYIDAARDQAVAQGEIKGIKVEDGTNITRDVTLNFIVTPNGSGTFRWEIKVPDGLSSATMKIAPLDTTTGIADETITFTGTTSFANFRPLNTGYYQLTFELTKTNAQKIVFCEFLHVYDNLESFYSMDFTDDYFNNILYRITFVYSNGSTGSSLQSRTHGALATAPSTTFPNKPTPAGLYSGTLPDSCTFDGWYNGDTKWNFNDPVTGDMTLTAHWTAARLVETVPANNVAAAISYVNSSPGAYTLLMDANASISAYVSLSGSSKLTITGQSAVTITNSNTLTVTDSAELTLGKNITFSGTEFTYLDINTNASLTLSDDAVIIAPLNLNATNDGNSYITINPLWTGSVNSLNLRWSPTTDITTVIGFWYNQNSLKTVLKGGGLNAETVAKFTLGKFLTLGGDSQPISAANPPDAPIGYVISTESGNIGKLVAINPAARIGTSPNQVFYKTLYAAINDPAYNGTPSYPGEIVILRDITVPEEGMTTATGYTIPAGKHIKLTVLSGQSHTIIADVGGFSLFSVNADSSLTLGLTTNAGILTLNGNDEPAASNRHGVYVNGGTFIMNDGVTITGFNNTGNGGGVNNNNGTFTMKGGKISYNKAGAFGGGVFSNYNFTMSDGEISNNSANNGGGVYLDTVSSNFTMSGISKISKNIANTSGGGVFLNGTDSFIMSGSSEISNNEANQSGAGVSLNSNGTFIMQTGTISGNTTNNAGSYGGGVFVSNGKFTMNGGTISGNTTNNAGSYGGGVLINGNGTFTMSGGTIYGSSSEPGLANTALNGASLYNNVGTALFDGDYGGGKYTIDNTIASTNNTLPGQPRYITSPTEIELVLIPTGQFMMGSPSTETGSYDNERPQHLVTMSGFYMGKYEVTQEQWVAVMGSNPSYFTSIVTGESGTPGKLPVETVSWYDALVFCNKLSVKEGLSPAYSISGSTDLANWGSVPTSSNTAWDTVVIVAGSTGYRLPTEAQWEYACRAGTTTAYNTGNTITYDQAWYDHSSGNKTHKVGSTPPNAWGLYDMHGNVLEWCWDFWDGSTGYSSGAQTDPTGPDTGPARVARGGYWSASDTFMRSANRASGFPYSRQNGGYGLRVVLPN